MVICIVLVDSPEATSVLSGYEMVAVKGPSAVSVDCDSVRFVGSSGPCSVGLIKLLLLLVFVGVLGAVFVYNGIIPIINLKIKTFSTPLVAVLHFSAVAVFSSLLLPSTPSMWAAGLKGYRADLDMDG
ncbi:unnamed protein product [Cuscuta epithymum]|uniref:Uncharacterized protein n=1 Tax=Cuscuta epithymum TaxID=186058 RepID=A0AAV0G7H0_9ASTE|nr:unnamed protein product [Cuscuta epithymum]